MVNLERCVENGKIIRDLFQDESREIHEQAADRTLYIKILDSKQSTTKQYHKITI